MIQEIILQIIQSVILLILVVLIRIAWKRVAPFLIPFLEDALVRKIVADGIRYAQKVYGELLDGPGRYQKALEAISLRLARWHIYVSPEELRILIESILIELQAQFGDKWYELSAKNPAG